LLKFDIEKDELSTVYTKDFDAPTEKSKCLFPVGKQWKFEKVKMYCFFQTSDTRSEIGFRHKGFKPDEHTPIEERYILFR